MSLQRWCEHCSIHVSDEELVRCRDCGDVICGNCRMEDGGDRCLNCVRRLLRDSMTSTIITHHRIFIDLIDDIVDFACDKLGLGFIWRNSTPDEAIIGAYKKHYSQHRFRYISNDPENEDPTEGKIKWVMM